MVFYPACAFFSAIARVRRVSTPTMARRYSADPLKSRIGELSVSAAAPAFSNRAASGFSPTRIFSAEHYKTYRIYEKQLG